MDPRYPVALAFTLLMLIAMPALAIAQGADCQPEAFSGEVTVNGNPAPDSLRVTAKVTGDPDNTEYLTFTRDGWYGLSPFVLIVRDIDSNCENPHTMEFFIEGVPAGTHSFENGLDTKFNISATGVQWCGDGSCNSGESCSSCPGDCGACDTGGSSGGGSSGGGGGGSFTPPVQECTPDWECSSWSQCLDDIQTRTCIDLDECDTDEDTLEGTGKPAEEQECGLTAILPKDCSDGDTACVGDSIFQCDTNTKWHQSEACEFGCDEGTCLEESQKEGSPFTGMFLDPTTLGGLVLALILLAVIYALWKRRGKPQVSGG